MSTPEGKVKDFIDKRMKEWFPFAVKYSPPGGRFGRAGMPDRLWFIRGNSDFCVVVAIEAKAEGVRGVTDLQRAMLERLVNCGVLCAVIIGKDEQAMQEVKREVLRRISLADEGPQ